jgi:hypothetical protein
VLAVVGLALVLSGVRRGQAMLAVGMAVFVLVSVSFGRYSLGLRFALVVLPLLYLAAGRLLAAATGRNRVLRTVLVGSTVLATLVDLALVYPYPRSYVNRLAVRGEKYEALADSDLDWGEGLVALGDFAARYRLGPLALSYHGAAAPGLFGVTTVWYENAVMGIRAPSFLPPEGLFFVSSTNLSGVYVGRERYAWLRGRAPVAVIGGTIYAFDLKNAPPTP